MPTVRPSDDPLPEWSWSVLEISGEWEPVRVPLNRGETATVASSQKVNVEQGPFLVRGLAVRAAIWRDNEIVRYQQFLAVPKGQTCLDSFERLDEYLKSIASPEQLQATIDRTWDEELPILEIKFQKDGGPALSAMTVQDFIDLNAEFVNVNLTDSAGHSLPRARLTSILNVAYQLGREVRDAEYPTVSAKSRGLSTGELNARKTEAWRREFLKWLQPVLDQESICRRSTLSFDDTVDLAVKCWPDGGFASQKVQPKRSTIAAAVKWGESEKLFNRPAAKRGRKAHSSTLN